MDWNAKPKMKYLLILSCLCLIMQISVAQPYATWDSNWLILDNGIIKRQLSIDPESGNFSTTSPIFSLPILVLFNTLYFIDIISALFIQ